MNDQIEEENFLQLIHIPYSAIKFQTCQRTIILENNNDLYIFHYFYINDISLNKIHILIQLYQIKFLLK
jgi:hypothetical protein